MIRHAELSPVKLDDNAIQYITDSMANNMLIQINYEGSGWRTIQPYSFTTSKDNNLLVMCYKQDGSIRSYRFDRINQLYVDDSLLQAETGVTFEDSGDSSSKNNPSDFEIPYLPEYDEILEESENEPPEPFADAIDEIEMGEMFEPEPVEDDDKKKDKVDYNLDENENEDENVDFNLDEDNNSSDKESSDNDEFSTEEPTESEEENGEETSESDEQSDSNQQRI